MHDLLPALLWTLVVVGGFAVAVVLRRRGVAAAALRDLLHVGAGVWVFGWHLWEGPLPAVAIPWAAVAVLAALPFVPRGWRPAGRVVAAVTSEDERWGGLVLYALAFAVLTTLALATSLPPGPAAVALLALAWGDGLGGVVGSRWGRRTHRLPWSKPKTWLGSLVVAMGTVAGALAWGAWASWGGGAPVPRSGTVLGAGLVAAVTEAVAPRGTDNLAVPAAVFVWFLIAT